MYNNTIPVIKSFDFHQPYLIIDWQKSKENSLISNWFNSSSSFDDSLTLYDGNSNTAPLIGVYCGQLPPSFISTSNEAFMHFQSDISDTNNNGFKLEYHPYSKLCETPILRKNVWKSGSSKWHIYIKICLWVGLFVCSLFVRPPSICSIVCLFVPSLYLITLFVCTPLFVHL